MHRVFKLQHHRHSGKLLPHHHTSYRTLGLLLAVAGIFMIYVQHSVGASSLYVDAKISAPIPTDAAIITNLTSPFISTSDVIELTGSCPAATPPNIVIVMEGKTVLGSTPCTQAGAFALTIPLRIGTQTIVAQIFNITDDPGPLGQQLTITYRPEVPTTPIPTTPVSSPAQPSSAPSKPSSSTPSELAIISTQPYYVFGPGTPAVWEGSFSGGIPPYAIKLDWGDGTIQTYNVADDTPQTFSHYYGTMDAFYITIFVQDSTGAGISRSYAAVTPYVPRDQTPQYPNGTQFVYPFSSGDNTMLGIYVAYALSILLVTLVWFDARHLRPVAVQQIPRQNKARAKIPSTQRHATRTGTKTIKGRRA